VKKYYFPLHASRIHGRFSRPLQMRAALIFALVAGLSCLPFYAIAQGDAAPVKSKASASYKAYEGGAFIIYQGPNGDAVCRDASIAEARALRAGASDGLHQINHLRDESRSSSAPDTVDSATGLTIILRATQQLENNQTAKAAFIAAAAKWEALIKDPITIIIDVDFGTTFFGQPFSGPDILGATSTQELAFENNYTDVRSRLISHAVGSQETAIFNALPASSLPTDIGSVRTVFAASPILRALGAIAPVADPATETNFGPPPKIAFNSAFNFDFNPNDGIAFNLTDFDAVAVHEMGHALGFNSAVGLHALEPTLPLAASIWDLFRFRPGTANLSNFGTAQRILTPGVSLQDVHVQFNGGPELSLSTGDLNGDGGDGEQASHWKDDSFGGPLIGIMDPSIRRGDREILRDNDLNAIDSFGYTLTAITRPPNDNFADAQSLSGSSGTVSGTNIFATRETGEPTFPTGTGGGTSVWYNWTAPASGQATFDTIGSNYDTILAVYTGTGVNALTHIVSNDDISPLTDPEPRNIQSRVTFTASQGTTYRIQVDGFDGNQGNIVLNWTVSGGPTPTPTPTPGPNTVQFSGASQSVNETLNATTKIDLTVMRTGNTSAAATVDYATADGTASDRSDYDAAQGTLFFAAGESAKSVTVFIVDDRFGEGPETFTVNLSNPVGCTLGSPAAFTVTINSNEAVNGPNPVKDATFDTDFFVRQHYVDFFNREPDAAGLAFWKNQIDECSTQECREIRRINVSAAFFLSIEFQQTGYLVERLYKTAYGSATGNSTLGGTLHQLSVPIVRLNEFLPDTQQIGRGVIIGQPGADLILENNKQALIAQFVMRSRFMSAYPASMTATQFVDALNTNAGGVLSQSERNQLIDELGSQIKTRAQVLRAVAEDSDLFVAETNRAFVLAQFFGYLRRNPNDATDGDYTGYDFWLGKLNQFNGNFVNAEMVKAFIVSGEYQARFGP
jgi:Calx-beta domain/Domain of unknown function (DUF4214)